MKYFLGILLFCVMFTPTFAHPGNTASDGCHYCRTNCDEWGVAWDQRHCHNTYVEPETEDKAATTNYTSDNNSDDSSLWTSVLAIGGIGAFAYFLGKNKTLG